MPARCERPRGGSDGSGSGARVLDEPAPHHRARRRLPCARIGMRRLRRVHRVRFQVRGLRVVVVERRRAAARLALAGGTRASLPGASSLCAPCARAGVAGASSRQRAGRRGRRRAGRARRLLWCSRAGDAISRRAPARGMMDRVRRRIYLRLRLVELSLRAPVLFAPAGSQASAGECACHFHPADTSRSGRAPSRDQDDCIEKAACRRKGRTMSHSWEL